MDYSFEWELECTTEYNTRITSITFNNNIKKWNSNH